MANRSISLVAIVLFAGVLYGAPAEARGYTALYVFGGSLEDNGNLPPVFPVAITEAVVDHYYGDRATNGYVYVEVLADSLGLGPIRPSSKGGTNYAHQSGLTDGVFRSASGYKSRTIRDQVADHLSSFGEGETVHQNALYLVNCGGMEESVELRGSSTDTAVTRERAILAAGNVVSFIQTLADVGARYFAVPEMVDLASFGWTEDYTHVTKAYNKALGDGLGELTDVNVAIVRDEDWIGAARRHHLLFGSSYAWSDFSGNPNDYFWLATGSAWHVSAAAHRLLAEVVLKAVNRRPEVANPIAGLSLILGGEGWRTDLFGSPQVFVDEDDDALTYSAASSDTAVVNVAIDRSTLTVTPAGLGDARITITVSDGANTNKTFFTVTVAATGYSLALDLDAADGDQALTSLSGVSDGWAFPVELHASGLRGAVAFQAVIQYDDTQLTFVRFDNAGVFTDFQVQITSDPQTVTLTSDTLAQGTTTTASRLGTLHFQTDGLTTDATVRLIDATLKRETHSEPLVDPPAVRLSARNCDFDGNGAVSFPDFLAFARAYGADTEDERYEARLDLNGSGGIDFGDFLLFAKDYGTAVAR